MARHDGHHAIRLVAGFTLLLAGLGSVAFGAEMDSDRPGRDYRNFELSKPDHARCEAACAAESACRAWTYVRPGLQGLKARCWLKSQIPPPTPSRCCVSGIRTVERTANIARQVQRLLSNLGYRPGPIDGRPGTLTHDAIRQFQKDHGLAPTGSISSGLIATLRLAQREQFAATIRPRATPPASRTAPFVPPNSDYDLRNLETLE
jgi:hypothetical protein